MRISPVQRHAAIAVIAALAGFAVDYAVNLLLSKHLAAEAFGDYRVARAFAVFCGALVLLGGDRAAPRVLSHALDHSDFSAAWGYLRFFGWIGVLLSALIIGFTWLGGTLHTGHASPVKHHAVSILSLTIPIMAIGALASRVLQTSGRHAIATVPWRIGAPISMIVGILLVDAVLDGVTLNSALVVSCVTVVLITAGQVGIVRARILHKPRASSESAEPGNWLRLSVPMMGAFLVTIGLAQSDLYFLEWLGDEAEVGHYAAAITTAHFVPMIQIAVLGVYAPLLSRAAHAGGGEALFLQATRVMALIIAPIALFIAACSEFALQLFGSEYGNAAPWLSLLVLGNGTWAIAAVSTLRLQYAGQGMSVVWITSATLLVDSVLNALLIPSFGPLGAAASSAATSAGAAAALWWRSRSICSVSS